MNPPPQRRAAKAFGVTASLIAGWIAYEGFTANPVIPVKGDVPTIGHGSTYYEDGRRVRMGDKPISRERARELAVNHLEQVYVRCVKSALGETPVSKVEFELAVDFAGQYGCAAYSRSSIANFTRQGNYVQACEAFLLYRFVAGFDCSTPGNRRCPGVWTRSQERHSKCSSQV